MGDRVAVHLYFDTDTPPPAVARAVMTAAVDHVPDKLDSIHWSAVDIEEEDHTDE